MNLSRIFLLRPATRLRTAPRSAVALSPIRTSPSRSKTATSPACRCLIFSSAIAETSWSTLRLLAAWKHYHGLFKVAERLCFAVVSIKDSQQLCDCQQVLQLLRQTEHF